MLIMTSDIHHQHLIAELAKQLEAIFSNSPQGIYLYLDDTHKACNLKFADMLGYSSIQEWVDNENTVGDIDKKDRDKVIDAYMEASQKFTATTLPAIWIKKDGKKIKTLVTMAPVTYEGETFVLHFVTPKGN